MGNSSYSDRNDASANARQPLASPSGRGVREADGEGRAASAAPSFPIPHSPFPIRTGVWAGILAFAFLLCLAATTFIWLSPGSPPGSLPGSPRRVARVSVDGVVVREIDLAAVTGEESFEVEAGGGRNTITLRPGGICVSEADCPDQVCVKRGWLEGGAAPIVCLPHRLVITLVSGGSEDALDAVSG